MAQSTTGKNQTQRQQTAQSTTGQNQTQRQNYGQNTQQSRQNYGQNAQQSRQNFANNYGSTGSGGAWSGGGSPGNWGGYYAGGATVARTRLALGATVQNLPPPSTPIVAPGNPYFYFSGVYY